MLSKWFVFLAVSIAAVQANESFFKNLASFHIDPGHRLLGHVIKTLSEHKADCMVTCKKTLGCFSINVYKDHRGNNKCDLNRSNKKQSPKSLVRMSGYDYAEPTDDQFCINEKCSEKKALPDDFFKFNSSFYKFFADKKNWIEARGVCEEHKGDLVSFVSPAETTFVFQTMLHGLPVETRNQDLNQDRNVTLMRLRMDGNDKNLSLASGARLEINDGKPALYVDGGNRGYAEIPRFDLHNTNLTFSMWVKPKGNSDGKLFLGYHEGSVVIEFDFEFTQIKTELTTPSMSEVNLIAKFNPSLSENTWVHLVITWDKDSRTIGCYTNGSPTPVNPNTIPNPNSDLFLTTDPMYKIGDDFNGWITDMVVISRILTQPEIMKLKDSIDSSTVLEEPQGAWIGLNDKTTEGVIHWSDGLPLTYNPSDVLNNDGEKDCGMFYKKSEGEGMRRLVECEKLAPFVCKIN